MQSSSLNQCVMAMIGGGIGDVLYHAAFLKAIYVKTGNKVIIACKKPREIRQLFEHFDFVAGVAGLSIDQDKSGKISIPDVIQLCKKSGCDTVWVFHHSLSLALAARLAGIKNRYGYVMPGKLNGLFLSNFVKLPRNVEPPYFLSQAKLLMEHMGVSFDINNVNLRQGDDTLRRVLKKVNRRQTGKMIALGLNCSHPSRQWGGENFKQLALKIAERFGGDFLLFGAADVHDIAAPLRTCKELQGRLIDLTSIPTDLAESHALLQNCLLYAGNDSFGLNLAAMSNIPAVGVFLKHYHFRYNRWIRAVPSPTDSIQDAPVAEMWKEILPLLG